jgi:hypothetical protein
MSNLTQKIIPGYQPPAETPEEKAALYMYLLEAGQIKEEHPMTHSEALKWFRDNMKHQEK